MELEALGWTQHEEESLATLAPNRDWIAGRVASAQRELYQLWSKAGILPATLSGRLRHEAGIGDLPVVGDWVLAARDGAQQTIIQQVIPRRTVLRRQRAGHGRGPQVLVANVDHVFIVSSLNQDWSPRRL